MEKSGKLPESDNTGDVSGVVHGFLVISDDEGDEFSPELSFKEEMVEEVMQELWKEISCSTSCTNPISHSSNFPSMPSSLFVDGKNESCGPSFSDSASTVMAGIEMGGDGGGRACLVGPSGKLAVGKAEVPSAGLGSWVLEKGCNGLGVDEGFGERMDGCDGVELDDEWLSRVLSWGPLETVD